MEFDHEPSRKEREEFIRNTIIVIVHRIASCDKRERVQKIVRCKRNKNDITGQARYYRNKIIIARTRLCEKRVKNLISLENSTSLDVSKIACEQETKYPFAALYN